MATQVQQHNDSNDYSNGNGNGNGNEEEVSVTFWLTFGVWFFLLFFPLCKISSKFN